VRLILLTRLPQIAYNDSALRPGVVRSFTLQIDTQKRENTAAPTLRRWLDERGVSERATLVRLWSLPEAASSSSATLAEAMLDPQAIARIVAALGPRERAALALAQQYGGRIPAPVLEREFGGVRAHANYPNPRAYLLALEQPPSPIERLWAMALLIAPSEADHAYVIPADLLPLLPPVPPRPGRLQLTPAKQPAQIVEADPRFLEQNLLLLLSLAQDGQLEVIPTGGMNKASLARIARQWHPKEAFKGAWREEHWPYIQFVRRIAEGAGLLRVAADSRLRPTHAALEWLKQPPIERARKLLEGWVASKWDELVSFEGIKIQRGYFRDLPAAKRAMLRLIGQISPYQWVLLADFVAQVKRVEPDFARPDGRYDTWGLLSYTRQPLNGFAHWEAVEGEQLKHVAGGSLRWLGLTDVGTDGERAASFRLTQLGAALLAGADGPPAPPVEPLVVQPNFEVVAPLFASPYARFQLGRIAEHTSRDTAEVYRLTKRSIQAALERGISYEDAVRFLREYSAQELPQNVVASLREWAGQHGQVTLRRGVLLEAQDSLVLEQIKRDKRVRMPAAEPLTKHAWLLREGDAPEFAERLRKAGYGLAGDGDNPHMPLREHDLTVLFAALEFYAGACAELGIEGDASGALRKRVARLLPDRALNRAFQNSHEALQRLKQRLEESTRQGDKETRR